MTLLEKWAELARAENARMREALQNEHWNHGPGVSDAQRAHMTDRARKAVALWESGLCMEEIAARLGCVRNTVRNDLVRAGLARPGERVKQCKKH